LEAPPKSRGVLRVRLSREFGDFIKTMSWSYLKLKPNIRYEPFEFNDLGGWTEEKVQKMMDEISSVL
jgi:hypothetical protein